MARAHLPTILISASGLATGYALCNRLPNGYTNFVGKALKFTNSFEYGWSYGHDFYTGDNFEISKADRYELAKKCLDLSYAPASGNVCVNIDNKSCTFTASDYNLLLRKSMLVLHKLNLINSFSQWNEFVKTSLRADREDEVRESVAYWINKK